MATLEQIEEGIRRADAAGDDAGVKALAAERQRMLAVEQDRRAVSQSGGNPDAPEVMTGDNPLPVDDSWFPANEPFQGYTIAHEGVAGAIGTLADVGNWIPNTINAGQEVYDLHFGSGTGEIAPERRFRPWTGEGGVITEFDPKAEFTKLNPQTPGWEETRRVGGLTGAGGALGGWRGAVALPALTKLTEFIGSVADTSFDENPYHKWERTLPLFAPTGAKAVAKVTPSWVTSPSKVAAATVGFTGNPTKALRNAAVATTALGAKKFIDPMTYADLAKTSVGPFVLGEQPSAADILANATVAPPAQPGPVPQALPMPIPENLFTPTGPQLTPAQLLFRQRAAGG
jgi:hypothetical protein